MSERELELSMVTPCMADNLAIETRGASNWDDAV